MPLSPRCRLNCIVVTRGEEARGGREIEEEKERVRKSRRKNCRGKIRLCGLAPVCYVKPSCVPLG